MLGTGPALSNARPLPASSKRWPSVALPANTPGMAFRAWVPLILLTAVGATPADAAPSASGPSNGAPAQRIDAIPPAIAASKADRWPGVEALVDRLATAAVRDAQRGDWGLARLYRLWNFDRLLRRTDRVVAAVDEIARRGKPIVRDHARFLQAELLRRSGQLVEARAKIGELGLMTDGWVIGPFDNSAGGGHAAVYPPEQGVDLAAELESRGRPLRWQRIRGLAVDGAVELSALLPAADAESTAYVAVVAYGKRRARAALRTGSADALKVWVNGRLVHDRDTRRFAYLDQDAIGIELVRGPNIILFKSSWRGDRGRLFARLTRPNGRPLNGIDWSGDTAAIAEAPQLDSSRPHPSKPVKAKSFKVRRIQDLLNSRPSGVPRVDWLSLRADLVAVMGLYDERRLPSPPEELMTAAVRASPGNPHLRFFLAHRTKARDPKLAREQLRAAVTADPGYAPAWLALGEMAREGQRLIEAKSALETAISRDSTFLPAPITRAVLGFEELSEHILAVRRLEQTPRVADSAEALVQLGRMRRALSDFKGARRDLNAALKIDFTHPRARQLLIDLSLDAADTKRARALVADQVALAPWLLGPRLRQIRLAWETDPELARQRLVETESLFISHPAVPALRGELDLRGNRKAAALAAFDRSLTLDPFQPNLRRQRRRLTGDDRDLADIYGVDARAASQRPATKAETEFGAAFLTDRTAVELSASGRSTKYHQQIIRVADARMKDALRAHRIFYSPSREIVEIIAADQIKTSGQVLKPTTIRDEGPQGKISGMYIDQRYKVMVFGDVEPGDTIHIAYRIDSRGNNIFGGFFGDVKPVQGPLPKLDFRYTVAAPASRPLYHATVRLPAPTTERTDTHHRLSWVLPEIPALDVEPMSPPYPRIGRLLSVSTYDAWDGLGQWYARLYGEQLELDEDARRAGREAVAGIDDPAEKVRRLYAYVVKNTRYVGIELGIHGWKPFKAAEVHRRRYGDCKDKSTLLSALLRDNGVNATITLVRTADRGRLPSDHATMWAFNHAITYVPELDWYLDPTAEFNGSGELPYQDQGAMALVVHPDGRTKLTTLPVSSPRDNLNASRYEARLSRDGRLVMVGEEHFHGARAAELRRELETRDKRRLLLERQLGQVFAGVRIRNLEVSDLEALEKPVKYRYRFDVPQYGQLDGNRLLIPIALYQHEVSKAYAVLPKRRHAVRLDHAWETNNVIRYRLPKGARITHLPEGIDIDTPYISLKQTVRRVDGGFETNDTVTIKQREIPPEVYAEFREACLAIDRAMARQVEIQW